MNRLGQIVWWVFAILAIYTVLSSTVYRFQNPHLSETQLFLDIPKAWFWPGGEAQ